MPPRDGKVETRLENLRLLRSGVLPAVNALAQQVWKQGVAPTGIRIRPSFYRLQVQETVEDERKPLPLERRPLAARMITPRGLTLKTFLMLLYGAQCAVKPGKAWPAPFPVEPDVRSDVSWLGLVASVAGHGGAGIHAASQEANRRRQLTQALKSLEGMELVRPTKGPGRCRQGFEILCENGKSTKAAAIRYTVPDDSEPYVELPYEFFTQGWVHVLTNSEIAALLMWFDRLRFHGAHLAPEGQPLVLTYVTGAIRQGLYGLGREAYETHQQLDAYQLLDVIRPEKRWATGKWAGYTEDSSDMLCHRVSLVPQAFSRDAGTVVDDVLRRRDTSGDWRRPLNSPPKRFTQFSLASPGE